MSETIVGISTTLGNSAINIIRLSGDDAFNIVGKIYKGKSLELLPTGSIVYGHIVDGEEIIDEVLVSFFKAPKSFTKENVVEINCHGGVYVTNLILQLLLHNGARIAEPGEFTKRAFLNGRIDLTQAESIMDVINAESRNSLRLANHGLNGDVKKRIEQIRDILLKCILKIEVNIDYPEYEDEEVMTREIILPLVESTEREISDLLTKSKNAVHLKSGINTAIVGKPNVGKSSILNLLIGEDKAIVTNIAGTTRDIVEGKINVGGIVLNLVDTAGIRTTEDVVECIGINKSLKVIDDSELIIIVFDNNKPLDDNDKKILDITKDKKRVIIINKMDLDQKLELSNLSDYVLISTFEENAIDIIKDKIIEVLGCNSFVDNDLILLNNNRQINKLEKAYNSLISAQKAIENLLPVDLINIDLNEAWTSLGEIIGSVTNDELINELFSRFCLGK